MSYEPNTNPAPDLNPDPNRNRRPGGGMNTMAIVLGVFAVLIAATLIMWASSNSEVATDQGTRPTTTGQSTRDVPSNPNVTTTPTPPTAR